MALRRTYDRGFVVALRTYAPEQEAARHQARKEAEAREEEDKRRFWEQQLDLNLRACKAVSILSTVGEPKQPEYRAARVRSGRLYHGELCVVESPEFEARMVQFRRAPLTAEGQSCDEAHRGLQQASLALAHACRKSIEGLGR